MNKHVKIIKHELVQNMKPRTWASETKKLSFNLFFEGTKDSALCDAEM